jgi:hypothetical protein
LARKAASEADKGTYEAETNAYLQDLLTDYNNRDQEKIRQHLDTVEDALNKENIGSCTLLFGGSIKKHTYISGLSDVDVLAVINDTALANKSPEEVKEYFAQRLRERLPNTEIRVGKLAVTVKFSDGHEVQVLPTILTSTGVRLPSSKGDRWSNIIHPEKFADKLTGVNKANNNGVVPVIKLFKAINTTLPEDSQLSGYHIEAIAINAFKNYQGGTSRKDMLMHMAKEAAESVLHPIKDKTGQSINVDDKLGPAGSLERQRANVQFQRFYNKMKLADSRNSVRGWKELFGNDS